MLDAFIQAAACMLQCEITQMNTLIIKMQEVYIPIPVQCMKFIWHIMSLLCLYINMMMRLMIIRYIKLSSVV